MNSLRSHCGYVRQYWSRCRGHQLKPVHIGAGIPQPSSNLKGTPPAMEQRQQPCRRIALAGSRAAQKLLQRRHLCKTCSTRLTSASGDTLIHVLCQRTDRSKPSLAGLSSRKMPTGCGFSRLELALHWMLPTPPWAKLNLEDSIACLLLQGCWRLESGQRAGEQFQRSHSGLPQPVPAVDRGVCGTAGAWHKMPPYMEPQ